MHRLWSDGRWNKLTVAHGCYWKKCSFCDVSLDYIGRYDAAGAELLVDRIEASEIIFKNEIAAAEDPAKKLQEKEAEYAALFANPYTAAVRKSSTEYLK